jgi:resorcinol 4-hydroxylase (NADPH)
MVTVGPAGSDCDAVDVEGTYAKWLEGIGATYVILRPDFYIAATAATEDELRRHFDQILPGLHLSGAPTTVDAAVALDAAVA